MRNNRTAGEPIYLTIATSLRNQIIEGKWKPGDILPSENELVEQFSTSRETVRKGLKALENEGYIFPRPGKGYFVATPEYSMFNLKFTEENEVSYIKNIHLVTPEPEVVTALHLEPGEKVLEVSRVIVQDKTPIAYDLKYLPYDKGYPTVEQEIRYAVFPEIAAAKTSPFAFSTRLSITAESAAGEIAKYLECREGEALLVARRYIISGELYIGYGVKYMTKGYGALTGESGGPGSGMVR